MSPSLAPARCSTPRGWQATWGVPLCHFQAPSAVPGNRAGGRYARSGRLRCTKEREHRIITRQALQAKMTTANTIRRQLRAATQSDVCVQIVRNRLHDEGLCSRRPLVRPRLTPRHRAARLAWSVDHFRWNCQQWAQEVFSDESRFCLEHNDGRIGVWRRPGERLAPRAVKERVSYNVGSVMVRACL